MHMSRIRLQRKEIAYSMVCDLLACSAAGKPTGFDQQVQDISDGGTGSMKEITLAYEQPKIKINGTVYDLLMSDYEVVKLGASILEKYQNQPQEELSSTQMHTDLTELSGLIDTILGEGATVQLAKGRPVTLKLIIDWFAVIINAICEEFVEHAVQ
jgi:hypothetical protein